MQTPIGNKVFVEYDESAQELRIIIKNPKEVISETSGGNDRHAGGLGFVAVPGGEAIVPYSKGTLKLSVDLITVPPKGNRKK